MFYVFMFCVSNTFFTGGEAPSHLQCRRPGGLTGDRVPCAVGGGPWGTESPTKLKCFAMVR